MESVFSKAVTDLLESLAYTAGSLALFSLIVMIAFLPPKKIAQGKGILRAARQAFPRSLYQLPGTRLDFLLYILNLLIIGPAIGIVVILFFSPDLAKTYVHLFGPSPYTIHNRLISFPVQFLAGLIAGELSFYAYHRLAHKNRFFWTAHRLHHSAEHLTFLTSLRVHPLDSIGFTISGLIIAAPLGAIAFYFTGIKPDPLLYPAGIVYGVFGAVQDKFYHSHVPQSFGRFSCLFISGHAHQIHHSAELRHRDKNFGANLALLDWLFGTLYIPDRGEVPKLGMSETALGSNNPHQNLRDALLEPFTYLRREIWCSKWTT
jgi:sterol desaturase/sphingolipid hydroxylase (fatty acid hydroxylase superfamily)